MTKTELDKMLTKLATIHREGAILDYAVASSSALPALVAEVERLRRCLDQVVDIGKFQTWTHSNHPDIQGVECSSVFKRTDKGDYPDLYAEIMAEQYK